MVLGKIIGATVVLLVGFSLLPTVAEQIGSAQGNVTLSPISETVLGLTTLFFALAIVGTALLVVISALRDMGLIGGRKEDVEYSSYYSDDEEEEVTQKAETPRHLKRNIKYKIDAEDFN